MAKHSYHREGREISEHEALDHNGMLRDGVAVRVRMTMRDAAAHRPGFRPARTMQQPRVDAAQYWRDNKNCLVVHDGSGNALGLHKPGFRMLDNDFGATAKAAAYHAYQSDVERAYLTFGSDPREIDDDYENSVDHIAADAQTDTESIGRNRTDGRSVNQIAADHQRRMSKIYDVIDAELSQAWRKG
jgi:hypothetical protein